MPEFNREQVIKDLWHSPDVSAAIGKMEPEELRDDLRQEMFLVLCEMDEGKLKGLHERGELRWYTVRVMLNMIQSNRSGFYNTHRKYREAILDGYKHMTAEGEIVSKVITEESFGPFFGEGYRFAMKHPESLMHWDKASSAGSYLIERVGDALQTIDPYEADMIRLYAEMGRNCQPVAKATGIQVRSVRYVVTAAKTKLKKKLRANVD